MQERRDNPPPNSVAGYLRQLPAVALLGRLPTPVLGVESSGGIGYANPACAAMLGYPDVATLVELGLQRLLVRHESLTPTACLDTLRKTDSVVEWNHGEGYRIRTTVSGPLLLRDTDELLLVSVVDITDRLWETEYARSG